MVRLGLVTYLLIATLAGPFLCCCTGVRLIAGFDSAACKDQAKSSTTNCCRHSHSSHSEKTPTENHKPDGPQCPCKQDSAQPVLSTPELDGSSLLNLRQFPSDWVFLPLLDGVQSSLMLSAVRPAAGDLWLLPFLSTRDILFHMHMLRC